MNNRVYCNVTSIHVVIVLLLVKKTRQKEKKIVDKEKYSFS